MAFIKSATPTTKFWKNKDFKPQVRGVIKAKEAAIKLNAPKPSIKYALSPSLRVKQPVFYNPLTKEINEREGVPAMWVTNPSFPNSPKLVWGKERADEMSAGKGFIVEPAVYDTKTQVVASYLTGGVNPDLDVARTLVDGRRKQKMGTRDLDQFLERDAVEEVEVFKKKGYNFVRVTKDLSNEETIAAYKDIVAEKAGNYFGASSMQKTGSNTVYIEKPGEPGTAIAMEIFEDRIHPWKKGEFWKFKNWADISNISSTLLLPAADIVAPRSPVLVAAQHSSFDRLLKTNILDPFLLVGKTVLRMGKAVIDAATAEDWISSAGAATAVNATIEDMTELWSRWLVDRKAAWEEFKKNPEQRDWTDTPIKAGSFGQNIELVGKALIEYENKASIAANSYREQSDIEMAAGNTEQALTTRVKAIEEDAKILRTRMTDDPLTWFIDTVDIGVYEAWTWQHRPDMRAQFMHELASVEFQLGRSLTHTEIDGIKQNYIDIGLEIIGDIAFDPTTWTGIGLVDGAPKLLKALGIKGVKEVKPILNNFEIFTKTIRDVEEIAKAAESREIGTIGHWLNAKGTIGLGDAIMEQVSKLSVVSQAKKLERDTYIAASQIAAFSRRKSSLAGYDLQVLTAKIAEVAAGKHGVDLATNLKNAIGANLLPRLSKRMIDIFVRMDSSVPTKRWADLALDAIQKIEARENAAAITRLSLDVNRKNSKLDFTKLLNREWSEMLLDKVKLREFIEPIARQKALVEMAKNPGKYRTISEATKAMIDRMHTAEQLASYRQIFNNKRIAEEATKISASASQDLFKQAVNFAEGFKREWLGKNNRVWKDAEIVTDGFIGFIYKNTPEFLKGIWDKTLPGTKITKATKFREAVIGAINFHNAIIRGIFTLALAGRPGYIMINMIDSNFRAMAWGVKFNTSLFDIIAWHRTHTGSEIPKDVFQGLQGASKEMEEIMELVNEGVVGKSRNPLKDWGSLWTFSWQKEGSDINVWKAGQQHAPKGSADVGAFFRQFSRPFKTFLTANTQFNNLTESIARTRTYHHFYLKNLAATQGVFMEKLLSMIPEEALPRMRDLLKIVGMNPNRMENIVKRGDAALLYSLKIPQAAMAELSKMPEHEAQLIFTPILRNLEDILTTNASRSWADKDILVGEYLTQISKDYMERLKPMIEVMERARDFALETDTFKPISEVLDDIAKHMEDSETWVPTQEMRDINQRLLTGEDIPTADIKKVLDESGLRYDANKPSATVLKDVIKKIDRVDAAKEVAKTADEAFNVRVNSKDLLDEVFESEYMEKGWVEYGRESSRFIIDDTIATTRNMFSQMRKLAHDGTPEGFDKATHIQEYYDAAYTYAGGMRRWLTSKDMPTAWMHMSASDGTRQMAFLAFDEWLLKSKVKIHGVITTLYDASLLSDTKIMNLDRPQLVRDLGVILHFDELEMIIRIDFDPDMISRSGRKLTSIIDPARISEFRKSVLGSRKGEMTDLKLLAGGPDRIVASKNFTAYTLPNARINVRPDELLLQPKVQERLANNNLPEAIDEAMKLWKHPSKPSHGTIRDYMNRVLADTHPQLRAAAYQVGDYETFLRLFEGMEPADVFKVVAEAGNRMAVDRGPQAFVNASRKLHKEILDTFKRLYHTDEEARFAMEIMDTMYQYVAKVTGQTFEEAFVRNLGRVTDSYVALDPVLYLDEAGKVVFHSQVGDILRKNLLDGPWTGGELSKMVDDGKIIGLNGDDWNVDLLKEWLNSPENVNRRMLSSDEILNFIQENELFIVKNERLPLFKDGSVESTFTNFSHNKLHPTANRELIYEVAGGGDSNILKLGVVDDMQGNQVLLIDDMVAGTANQQKVLFREALKYARSQGITKVAWTGDHGALADLVGGKFGISHITEPLKIAEGETKTLSTLRMTPEMQLWADTVNPLNMRSSVDGSVVANWANEKMPDWEATVDWNKVAEIFQLDTFKKWDGGKVLRNSDGTVKYYYHGEATYGHPTFNRKFINGGNLRGKGIYFTESSDVAAGYQKNIGNVPFSFRSNVNSDDILTAVETGYKQATRVVRQEMDQILTDIQIYFANNNIMIGSLDADTVAKLSRSTPEIGYRRILDDMTDNTVENALLEFIKKATNVEVPAGMLDDATIFNIYDDLITFNEIYNKQAQYLKKMAQFKTWDSERLMKKANSVIHHNSTFFEAHDTVNDYVLARLSDHVETIPRTPGTYTTVLRTKNPLHYNTVEGVEDFINKMVQLKNKTDDELHSMFGSNKLVDIYRNHIDRVERLVNAPDWMRLDTPKIAILDDEIERMAQKYVGDGIEHNLMEFAHSLGFDSIIHTGGGRVGDKFHEVVIVWDGTQIKSIFNDGMFSESSYMLHMAQQKGKAFGQMGFLKDARAFISLFHESANPLAFAHELAHSTLPHIKVDDFNTLTRWGTKTKDKSGKIIISRAISQAEFTDIHTRYWSKSATADEMKIYTEYQEAWANGFVKYLSDPKSLPEKLQRMYAKVKAAIAEFYKTHIKGTDLDVRLNTEMKNMYAEILGAPNPVGTIGDELIDKAKMTPQLPRGQNFIPTNEYRKADIRRTLLEGWNEGDAELDTLTDSVFSQKFIADDARLEFNKNLIEKYVDEPARKLVEKILDEGGMPTYTNAYGKGPKGVKYMDIEGVERFAPLTDADYPTKVVTEVIDKWRDNWNAVIEKNDLRDIPNLDITTPETFFEDLNRMVTAYSARNKSYSNALKDIGIRIQNELNALPNPEGLIPKIALDASPSQEVTEGLTRYLDMAQSNLKQMNQVLEILNKWKEGFSEMAYKANSGHPDAWFLTEDNELMWNMLGRAGNDIADEMRAFKDILDYGGEYGGQKVAGAVEAANDIMIDYTTAYAWENFPIRTLFPFWTFPSRSIPFWAETLASHPKIVKHYTRYMQYSNRQQRQAGLVNSKGELVPSYVGYTKIPGTDYWFNPTAPLSFRILFPTAYEDIQTAPDTDENQMSMVAELFRFIYEASRLRGVSMTPFAPSLARYLGLITEEEAPKYAVIPQADLIPKNITGYLNRKAENATIGRQPLKGLADTFIPQLPYQDALIERDIFAATYQQVNELIYNSPNEEEGRRQAIELMNTLDLMMKKSAAAREVDPLWMEYRKKYENEGTARSWIGFLSGVFLKKYTSEDAEYRELQHEIRLYKAALNDSTLTKIFELADSQYDITDKLQEKMYNTFEGQIWGYDQASSWVKDEAGNELTGSDRRDRVAEIITKKAKESAYFDSISKVYEEMDERLENLPIGTPWDVRKIIFTDAQAELDEIKRLHGGDTDYEWSVYNKSPESQLRKFENDWWSLVTATEPQYNRGKETYTEYVERRTQWENELPKLGQALGVAFTQKVKKQLTQLFGGEAGIAGEKLAALMISNTTIQGYADHRKDKDDAYDALMNAWSALYLQPYYSALDGKTNEEYQLAERKILRENPSPPTLETSWAWIQKEYGSKYTFDEIKEAWNGTIDDPLTVPEYQTQGKTEAELNRQEALEILGGVPVGVAKGEFNALFTSPDIRGTDEELDKLYSDPEKLSDAEMSAILAKLKKTAVQLGFTKPSDVTLTLWSQARTENDEFKLFVGQRLGETFLDEQSWFYGKLGYAEQAAHKKANPLFAKKLDEYSDLKDFWAKGHPVWSSLYAPGKTTSSSGGGYSSGGSGGSRGTSRGGYSNKSTVTSGVWQYSGNRDVQTPYRSTLDASRLLGGNLMGKGGVSGRPVWPNDMVATMEFNIWKDSWPQELRDAMGEVATSAIKDKFVYGSAISEPTREFITGLGERHPEWLPILNSM